MAVQELRERAEEVEEAYAHGHDRPLGSYVGIMGAYAAAAVAAGLLVRRRGEIPSIDAGDLALLGVATHKLSRALAKDPITSPLRAPFTRFEGSSGPAEVQEDVRGTGARHALGEMLSCPFCLGQWVATSFMTGLSLAPRATRAVAGVFATLAASDTLQLLYDKLEDL